MWGKFNTLKLIINKRNSQASKQRNLCSQSQQTDTNLLFINCADFKDMSKSGKKKGGNTVVAQPSQAEKLKVTSSISLK